jgi:hypothetical protein
VIVLSLLVLKIKLLKKMKEKQDEPALWRELRSLNQVLGAINGARADEQ